MAGLLTGTRSSLGPVPFATLAVVCTAEDSAAFCFRPADFAVMISPGDLHFVFEVDNVAGLLTARGAPSAAGSEAWSFAVFQLGLDDFDVAGRASCACADETHLASSRLQYQ